MSARVVFTIYAIVCKNACFAIYLTVLRGFTPKSVPFSFKISSDEIRCRRRRNLPRLRPD